MKVGILTFHRAINAGAVLQAYAMQETLNMLGYETVIVDYQPDYIDNAYKAIRSLDLRHPRGLLYELASSPIRYCRNKKFAEFREDYLKIEPFDQLNSCDYAILGSDQIWNSSITSGQLDKVFFNAHEQHSAKHGIAYAASTMSLGRLTEKDLADFKELLPKLDAIGVRERGFCEFLSQTYNLKTSEVIDPTLLAEKKVYESFVDKPYDADDYLVFYEVWHNDEVERKARLIAKEKNLRFIGVSGSDIRLTKSDTLQVFSPKDLVKLIANASHVVTSSFHGTAFSLIFEKQFNVICEEPHQAVRMNELLARLGLTDRLTFGSEKVSNELIEYKAINQQISEYRNKSLEFINKNFK